MFKDVVTLCYQNSNTELCGSYVLFHTKICRYKYYLERSFAYHFLSFDVVSLWKIICCLPYLILWLFLQTFTADGRKLIVSSMDSTVRTWDLPSEKSVNTFYVETMWKRRNDIAAKSILHHFVLDPTL